MNIKHLLCTFAALIVFATPVSAQRYHDRDYHRHNHHHHGGSLLLGIGAGVLIGGAILESRHPHYGTMVVTEDPPDLYNIPYGYTYQQRYTWCTDSYGRSWVCRTDWVLVPLD